MFEPPRIRAGHARAPHAGPSTPPPARPGAKPAAKPGAEVAAGADRANVWSRYRENTARHLIGIARDFEHRAMAQLERAGFDQLRPSLGPPISLIAVAPRPLGELAQRLAVSPQAASQLVGLGERAGYLERRRDDSDRRARRVHLTERGRELVLAARRALTSIEDDYRALIGGGAMAALEAGLGTLFGRFGLLGGLTPNAPGETPLAQPTIGTLPLLSIRVQRDLMEATSARGHRGLKMSHAQVLPLIGPGGARVNELARIQGISRQAVSSTARDLEKLGVLRRDTAPSDGRAVVYRLTRRGEHLIRDSIESVDALDARMAEILGDRGLTDLRKALAALYRRLHLEQEIFTASTADANRPAHDAPSVERREASGPGQLAALAESLRERLTPQEQARLAALLAARGPLPNPETTPRHGPDAELAPLGRIE